ncbi:hypothetical protein KNT64_gp101 [Pseudomonas phage PspYZU05]|uniref:Lysozyme n=1 Tax=Pseudomonas phage PspYZU05 TaxID=1983556 RepID=A0A2U7N8B0_9CAUD|nr:hypothetical protein KNT64_gp101 [Pseudomonas phage PspYZU05]ASD52053.1 hypothetical protein PspYZU05_101 [Pseudomonas phage PspYZU05]
MLVIDEGQVLEMYLDTEGYWTVGIGHKLHKDKEKSIELLRSLVHRETSGSITPTESFIIFKNDRAEVTRSIRRNDSLFEVYNSLDDERRKALENMVFQMGATGVAAFKKSLKLLKEKKWLEACEELKDSKWYRQTPNRAKRVIKVFGTGSLEHYKNL